MQVFLIKLWPFHSDSCQPLGNVQSYEIGAWFAYLVVPPLFPTTVMWFGFWKFLVVWALILFAVHSSQHHGPTGIILLFTDLKTFFWSFHVIIKCYLIASNLRYPDTVSLICEVIYSLSLPSLVIFHGWEVIWTQVLVWHCSQCKHWLAPK